MPRVVGLREGYIHEQLPIVSAPRREVVNPPLPEAAEQLASRVTTLIPVLRRASVHPGDRVRPCIEVARALLFDTAETTTAAQLKERP